MKSEFQERFESFKKDLKTLHLQKFNSFYAENCFPYLFMVTVWSNTGTKFNQKDNSQGPF